LVERGLGGALVLHRFVIGGHSGSFVLYLTGAGVTVMTGRYTNGRKLRV
jgi:hypothetical protein